VKVDCRENGIEIGFECASFGRPFSEICIPICKSGPDNESFGGKLEEDPVEGCVWIVGGARVE